MKAKPVLTTLLGLSLFALPAAVPASQPQDIRTTDRTGIITATPAPGHFATLISDPHRAPELAIVFPTGFTTYAWIDQDPFAN